MTKVREYAVRVHAAYAHTDPCARRRRNFPLVVGRGRDIPHDETSL
jgi:hypothetical protein